MTDQSVLQVSGARLAAVPQVAESARAASAALGVDLLDDAVAARVLAEHRRLKDSGGWHDELGAVLVVGGLVGALILKGSLGSTPLEAGQVAGFAAACAAVPLGLLVWVLGSRSGSRKQQAAERFAAYGTLLRLAREAGVPVDAPVGWAPAAGAQPGAVTPGADASGLPVLPARLITQDHALWRTAAEIGSRHGVDYLDEQAVRTVLGAQKKAVGRIQLQAGLITLGLLLAAGAAWIGTTLHAPAGGSGHGSTGTAFFTVAGGFGVLTLLFAVQLVRGIGAWRASGTKDRARGYLELLEAAHRAGLRMSVPSWLDTGGISKNWS
jgi:hypothetical protein